jgi:sulfate adenylyltransferase subunit 1
VALLPQTRRHTLLASLLRVPSIVFAVNKLDAVVDPGASFAAVREALEAFAAQAGIEATAIVPLSALRGDNVTRPLDAPWYGGPSLLQVLEGLPTAHESSDAPLALPVQFVSRPGDGRGHSARVFWGRIAQGSVKPGDVVQVLPGGQCATVTALRRAGGATAGAKAGQSAGLVLDRQIDVSRGDWIGTPGSLAATRRFAATLAWLDTDSAAVGRRYWLRHGHRWVQGRIAAIDHVLDIHTLAPDAAHPLAVNEIGRVTVEVQEPLPLQRYADNRVGGALIVVDPATHRTSGALLVEATVA